MTIKNFLVDTKHRAGIPEWEKISHPFRVHSAAGYSDTGLYVDSPEFGCSRTYDTAEPEVAIRQFLSEHACTAHNIQEETK